MIIYAKRERDNKLNTQVQSIDTKNVGIRLHSHDWYKQLNLPGENCSNALLNCTTLLILFGIFKITSSSMLFIAFCTIRNNVWTNMWNSNKVFDYTNMICTLNSVMRDIALCCRTTLRLPHSCAVLQDNQLKFEFILQTVWKFTVHYVRVQHQHIYQHGFLHVLQANIVSSNYFTTLLW